MLAVLALLAGGGIFAWVMYASSAYHKAIAFADEHDPGWHIDQIEAKRATYPDAQNGAVQIVLIKSLLPNGWQSAQKDELLRDIRPEQLMNEQQIAAVRSMLAAVGPALAESRKMVDYPHGRHTITYAPDFISTVLVCQSNRDALNVLNYDAMDLAQRGDADGAVGACQAMLHCGTSIGDEPFMISMLVRIACQAVAVNAVERVLAQGTPSEERLAAIQDRIEAAEREPLLLYGVRGERAGEYHLLENIRNGTIGAGVVGSAPGATPAVGLLTVVPGFMSHQITGCLNYTNEMVELAKTPPQTWAGPMQSMDAKARDLPVLARLLAPAMTKVGQACIRNHAQLRCAFAMVAAERFRNKHGRWPESLDELVKAGSLKSIPLDPYVGNPLRLKRVDDGLVIYSVGPDQTDDGGKFDRSKPLAAGTDWGFRLWDPAKRRQPAPPPKPPEEDQSGRGP
ncbi:MAG: hypothetical protein U0746_11500 [Gemmataceae bacterium]